MFKRVLVPIDPAKPFAAANDYAVALAQRFSSEVIATYVLDENLLGPSAQQTTGAMDEALEWVGRDAMDDFAAHHPELQISKRIAYGSVHTSLFQAVLQSGADVLVLGGFHTGSLGLWGSIAGDIVHHCERSCFVVRRVAELPGPNKPIIVPYDGTSHPRATLARIARLARELDAPIDLVYAARAGRADNAAAFLKEGAAILMEEGVASVDYHVLARGRLASKARMLHRYACDNGALLALSRIGKASMHTGRSRTVGWLVGHSSVPVWVVRK